MNEAMNECAGERRRWERDAAFHCGRGLGYKVKESAGEI